jgi:hypothetical protein
MSIAEMKLTAIQEVIKLTNENDVAEILRLLARLSAEK